MSVALNEQETSINFSRDKDMAEIYTSDSTVMTRLDKLAQSDACPDWKMVRQIYDRNGDLVAKVYQTKKRLVSYRAAIVERELTDEQREAMAGRIREWQAKKKDEKEKTEKGEI